MSKRMVQRDYAGLDFMTTDISAPQDRSSYRIIEVNSLPDIGMHLAPGRGKPRNVAGMLADLIFPETAVERVAKRSSIVSMG